MIKIHVYKKFQNLSYQILQWHLQMSRQFRKVWVRWAPRTWWLPLLLDHYSTFRNHTLIFILKAGRVDLQVAERLGSTQPLQSDILTNYFLQSRRFMKELFKYTKKPITTTTSTSSLTICPQGQGAVRANCLTRSSPHAWPFIMLY